MALKIHRAEPNDRPGGTADRRIIKGRLGRLPGDMRTDQNPYDAARVRPILEPRIHLDVDEAAPAAVLLLIDQLYDLRRQILAFDAAKGAI